MLRRTVIIGLFLGVSCALPMIYESSPEVVRSFFAQPSQPILTQPADISFAAVSNPLQPSGAAAASGRKVEIQADDRGHYTGAFKINGRKFDALIDTGATAVAVNVSTARRLGVHLMASDMKNTVNTANGKARATVVQIDRIEIGRIVVENVPALVLEDDALSTVLVGMTFLSRLKKFESDGKTMLLVQ